MIFNANNYFTKKIVFKFKFEVNLEICNININNVKLSKRLLPPLHSKKSIPSDSTVLDRQTQSFHLWNGVSGENHGLFLSTDSTRVF